VTHIDPFAPGNSPQHPANWGKEQRADVAVKSVEDMQADLYQWRRDHLTMASEAGQDVDPEVLEERHDRYSEYLADFGSPDEREESAEFVSFPALLRRAVLAEHDDDQHDEWIALFEQFATDDERDPMWVEKILPDLGELHARAAAEAASKQTAELPPAPKGNALKEDWVEYAVEVSKLLGDPITAEEANAMNAADLKAKYKPKAD